MNIDPRNSSAAPDPSLLTGIKYARFAYNISNGTGITTPQTAQDAANLYAPYIDRLRSAGKVPIIVLTHQTYGEGRDWRNMSSTQWQAFVDEWVTYVTEHVVKRYIGKCIWQVWNEQDNGSEAAVGVEPPIYSMMLRRTWNSIKGIDGGAPILTGGFVSGPGLGLQYASRMEPNWMRYCNGVATHEYGSEGATPYPGNSTGRIEPKIAQWKNATGKPIWITEYGVLNNPDAPYNTVVNYTRDFMKAIEGRAETGCYFAYGHQHNGYPVIGSDDRPRPELLAAAAQTTTTTPPDPSGGATVRYNISINLRSMPTTQGAIATVIPVGGLATISEGALEVADGYVWVKTQYAGFSGWTALVKNQTFTPQ